MDIRLRAPAPDDAAIPGRICHLAFATVAQAHGVAPDVPNEDVGAMIVGAHPDIFGVVAEENGRIAGSNFLDERNPISGVGPITVDPALQNSGAGFLAPTSNGELIRWALAHGLRITQTMTLMSNGLYNTSLGAWLPSVTY